MAQLPDAAQQRPPQLDVPLKDYLAQRLAVAGLSLRPDALSDLLAQPALTTAREQLDEAALVAARAMKLVLDSSEDVTPPAQWQKHVLPCFDLPSSSEPAAAPPTDEPQATSPQPLPDELKSLPNSPVAIAATIAAEPDAPAEPPAMTNATPPPVEPATADAAAASVATPALPAPPPRPQIIPLRLPNATSGTAYGQRLNLGQPDKAAAFEIAEVLGLADSGLQFDAASQQLTGTPTARRAETQTLRLHATLRAADGAETSRPLPQLLIELFINADPRALWNTIEPDAALPHRKAHQHAEVLRGSGWQAAAASVRGRSHAHAGSFREDDFRLAAEGDWVLMAVSDGAGSAKLSRRGSQLACETAVATLRTQLPVLEAAVGAALADGSCNEVSAALQSQCLLPLGKSAYAACKAINDEAKQEGTLEKDYSATLLLAAVRPHAQGFFVASYWVGDGALALYNPGSASVRLLGEADSGEFSGQTRFLLATEFNKQPDPWTEIGKRISCAWAPREAVLLMMSDGVSDPKFGTDNALKSSARWQALWQDDLAPTVDWQAGDESLKTRLTDWLGFWSPGEHDDRTLAVWQLREVRP